MSTRQQRGSLFQAMSESLLAPTTTTRMQQLEVALGCLGFFALVTVLTTAAAQLRGEPAVGEALVAGAVVATTWAVYRRWRRLRDHVARRGAGRAAP